jgi:transcriptional regulator with XRE-family HTH domain
MYPNLKLEIFRQGLHQNRLAKELGIQEAILSKIIRGNREPSESQKTLLANYLRTDVDWLFQKHELTMSAPGANGGMHADVRETKNGNS